MLREEEAERKRPSTPTLAGESPDKGPPRLASTRNSWPHIPGDIPLMLVGFPSFASGSGGGGVGNVKPCFNFLRIEVLFRHFFNKSFIHCACRLSIVIHPPMKELIIY